MRPNNEFSYAYYRQFLTQAREAGYTFHTVGSFLRAGSPKQKAFVIRHDLDVKPAALPGLLRVEKEMNVRSSVYVRVTANDYNAFSYLNLQMLRDAEKDGFEIGLHSNFVEYATIHNLDPFDVLGFETDAMRTFFYNSSLAPHRDLNYTYNSLPWLEKNWDKVQKLLGYDFHAYDSRIMDNVVYVNEGYNPHLCWRSNRPEEVIPTGKSICLLTHPHWWFDKHPFEAGT